MPVENKGDKYKRVIFKNNLRLSSVSIKRTKKITIATAHSKPQ
jgi:hypothetical protein